MEENNFNTKDSVNAWFDDLKKKIDVLPELKGTKRDGRYLEDEAYILCIVYLDQLSNRFQGIKTIGKWRFCDLLINYSGNLLFANISFRQLLLELKKESEKSKKKTQKIKDIFEKLFVFFNSKGCNLDENSLISKKGSKLYSKIYTKKGMLNFVKNVLIESEFQLLNEKIDKGRGSIASFCYDKIRSLAIHEHGPSGCWVIGGEEISFEVLYSSLKNIYQYIKKDYEKTGKFLGYVAGVHPFSK